MERDRESDRDDRTYAPTIAPSPPPKKELPRRSVRTRRQDTPAVPMGCIESDSEQYSQLAPPQTATGANFIRPPDCASPVTHPVAHQAALGVQEAASGDHRHMRGPLFPHHVLPGTGTQGTYSPDVRGLPPLNQHLTRKTFR